LTESCIPRSTSVAEQRSVTECFVLVAVVGIERILTNRIVPSACTIALKRKGTDGGVGITYVVSESTFTDCRVGCSRVSNINVVPHITPWVVTYFFVLKPPQGIITDNYVKTGRVTVLNKGVIAHHICWMVNKGLPERAGSGNGDCGD